MTQKAEAQASVQKKRVLSDLWKLGAPTVVEEALQTAVLYVDTAMVGHIGATASAAVGLTSTVSWLFYGALFSVSVGLLAYIARYTGAGDLAAAKRTSEQAIWVVLVLGVIETIAALAISPVLPRWMNGDPEIWKDASTYFFIVSLPMIPRGALIIYSNVLRANKDSRTPMVINIIVNVINLVLNQLFIGSGTTFHILGLSLYIPGTGWGIAGAAIATAISQVFGGIAIFIVAMRNPLTTLRGVPLKPDYRILRQCCGVAIPLSAERLAISIGHVAYARLVAGLGTLSMASHAIAMNIEEAFYIPGYGMQTAVSTLVGNAVGKKDMKELREVARAGLKIAVSIMTVMSVFLFLFPDRIMALFSTDAEVIRLGATVLRIVAVSEPLFAVLIIYEGVFHGIGETKVPFLFAVLTMWGIRIFGTWFLIRLFQIGLEEAWICMVMDNVCRCLLLVFWFFLGRWKKRLDM